MSQTFGSHQESYRSRGKQYIKLREKEKGEGEGGGGEGTFLRSFSKYNTHKRYLSMYKYRRNDLKIERQLSLSPIECPEELQPTYLPT